MDSKDRILIVDDDPEIRRLLVDYLAKNGYEPSAARDDREMAQALERHAIDLLVLDLMLPGTDGLTLCRDIESPPLPESGPTETRRAAEAFNRMQERLKRLIAERSRALAAVSHDLRTPLTHLRLRAELVDDQALRAQINADIDDMQAMVESTLDYLRGLRENEPLQSIDMSALLNSLVVDAQALGHSVTLADAAAAPYVGRLSALKRALGNLINNAVKYGESAHVVLEDSGAMLRISIEDRGPGIPEADLARVLEPYVRIESSRSRETGGIGLGLAIARDAAILHNGDLLLENRPEGGLRATLRLPRG